MNQACEFLKANPHQALRIGLNNLRDLKKMHDASLIHADTSPVNIATHGLIDINGLDDGTDAGLDNRGSEGFTAPESIYTQTEETSLLTQANDVYALGMTLNELFNANGLYHELPEVNILIQEMTHLDPKERLPLHHALLLWEAICESHDLPTDITYPSERIEHLTFESSSKVRQALANLYHPLEGRLDADDRPKCPLYTLRGAKEHFTYPDKLYDAYPHRKNQYSNIHLSIARRELSHWAKKHADTPSSKLN